MVGSNHIYLRTLEEFESKSSLEARSLQGRWPSVCSAYIDLKKITTMNHDNGFELHYLDQKVVVEGRNLKECYRYIKKNRLDSMLESERASVLAVVQQAVINSVKIAIASPKR